MYDHFSPAGVKLNTLLKPTILHLHSIFVLDVDGQLHEHAKVNIHTAPVFCACQSDVWSRLMRSGCGTATRIIRLNGQGALLLSLLLPYRSPQLLQHGRRCPLALVFPRVQRGTTVRAVAVLAIVVTSMCAGTSVIGTERSGQSPLPCPYCLALRCLTQLSPLPALGSLFRMQCDPRRPWNQAADIILVQPDIGKLLGYMRSHAANDVVLAFCPVNGSARNPTVTSACPHMQWGRCFKA